MLNRSTISYDLTLTLHLDEVFTPAVISAIDALTVSSFQVNRNGNAIIGEVTSRGFPLESDVIQGPVTLYIPFNDFAGLPNGLGYSLVVSNT